MSLKTNLEIELVRNDYKPKHIKVLFVGESAPSGGKFFYFGNSMLAKYSIESYKRVYGINELEQGEFLKRFKRNGFYLDDICHLPINDMTPRGRRDELESGLPNFKNRLLEVKPRAIISIMKGINRYIIEAKENTICENIPFYKLPFAGNGHQNRYVEGLIIALNELKANNIINSSFK